MLEILSRAVSDEEPGGRNQKEDGSSRSAPRSGRSVTANRSAAAHAAARCELPLTAEGQRAAVSTPFQANKQGLFGQLAPSRFCICIDNEQQSASRATLLRRPQGENRYVVGFVFFKCDFFDEK